LCSLAITETVLQGRSQKLFWGYKFLLHNTTVLYTSHWLQLAHKIIFRDWFWEGIYRYTPRRYAAVVMQHNLSGNPTTCTNPDSPIVLTALKLWQFKLLSHAWLDEISSGRCSRCMQPTSDGPELISNTIGLNAFRTESETWSWIDLTQVFLQTIIQHINYLHKSDYKFTYANNNIGSNINKIQVVWSFLQRSGKKLLEKYPREQWRIEDFIWGGINLTKF